MPLGLVTDDEFDFVIDGSIKPSQPVVAEIIPLHDKSRGLGNNQVPEPLKKVIIDEAITGTPAKELSDIFGISQSSISAYKVGSTSTASYHSPNGSLTKHIKSTRERIASKASRVLKQSLDGMTEEKLNNLGPVNASVVARNMSAIIKDMGPNDVDEVNIQQNVIYYAPRLRSEDEFESIKLNE